MSAEVVRLEAEDRAPGCRHCGCTPEAPCVGLGGDTCRRVEPDLCSFCARKAYRAAFLATRGGLRIEEASTHGCHYVGAARQAADTDRAMAIGGLAAGRDPAVFERLLDAIGREMDGEPYPGEPPAEDQLRLELAARVLHAIARAGFDVAPAGDAAGQRRCVEGEP